MNIQRFQAPTSRQALAKARMAFGERTLILSNRSAAGGQGVEVVATDEDALLAFDADTAAPAGPPAPAPQRSRPERNPVEEDAERLAMSTLSFQDYVRERMLRRRHLASDGSPTPAPDAIARHEPIAQDNAAPAARRRQEAQASAPRSLQHELQAMQAQIEDRFNLLAWLGQARQHPIQSQLLLKLIRAGYSPGLARALLERMPQALSAAQSVRWLLQALERNLHTDQGQAALHEQGGVFALTGATGVGKTSAAARLAALCVQANGPGSVALVTLDNERAGAHEQLRALGRTLGVVAHAAHDRAALQELLALLGGKKLVLIDTAGLAPRDPRQSELLTMLDLPRIERLLVLNAGSHGDTLDAMLGAAQAAGAQAILSKVDEAAKLGPALDALIRHRMRLRGVSRGQRLSEDWQRADAQQLVAASMRAPARSAFDPQPGDLGFFFAQARGGGAPGILLDA